MINWQGLLILPILTICCLIITFWILPYERKRWVRKIIGGAKHSVPGDQISNPIRSVLTKHGLEADPELMARFDDIGGELEDADKYVLEHVLSIVLRDNTYGSLEQRAQKAQSLCSEYLLTRQNARDAT